MPPFSDVFISYGRADSQAFAARLKQRLLAAGLSVWLDLESIPKAVDYQQQIDDDLERAHNFLFIMSPHAVNSPYCRLEIERAVALHKRIIPLLQVAEIDQATWQQRNPQAPLDEWLTYRAQGLCFGNERNPNLHPAIRKLNWLPFGEDAIAFEAAVQTLLSIIHHQQDYVQMHTDLLVKALTWEQQQRQSRYLLVAEERQQAEAWLLRRFSQEQPPCTPTDLHCEFITESLKNARNLMSQVFLTHAEADEAAAEQARRSLMRAGLTVWSSHDIPSGMDIRAARQRGIEEADNLIYLLSPDSAQAPDCLGELDYALSLNKRVVPILVRPTSAALLPTALKDLHYIDLTDNLKTADYSQDESELLRILQQDAAYYAEHKMLLAKALKWQRQHQNPSLLLRGYNLRYAETWLQIAQQRPRHRPTPLHEEFIAESLRQPPESSLDVFISYSRADSDFARQVNDALQAQGKRTWFDQESIAAGTADFSQEICRGIETSDNFLFILSPKSVGSPYCATEVEHAASLHKRFVTVLYRPVDVSALHPELAKVQWIDFSKPEPDFNTRFNQLVRVLDTDREHVHSHTKWLQRAIEWAAQNQSADLLLRGSECAIANAWLTEAEQYHKQPVATPLQKAFIQASCEAVTHEQRREQQRNFVLKSLTLMMSAVAIVAVSSSAWAFKTQRQAKQGEIAALVESSRVKFRSGQQLDALLASLQAGRALQKAPWLQNVPNQNLHAEVMASLHQAIHWTREQHRFEGYKSGIGEVRFSPNGQIIATNAEDAGEPVTQLARVDGSPLALHNQPDEPIKAVVFDPTDGSNLDLAGAFPPKPEVPERAQLAESTTSVIAVLGQKGTVELWHEDGSLFKQIATLDDGIVGIDLSAENQVLVARHEEGHAHRNKLSLWSTRDGKLKNRLPINSANKSEQNYWLSPTEQTIAILQPDKTTQVRSLDGRLIGVLNEPVWGWSQDGQQIATLQESDGAVKLWQTDGTLTATLKPAKGKVQELFFSPDSQTIAVQVDDGQVQLWSSEGQLIGSLRNETTPKKSYGDQVVFSPDGQWLAINYLGETSTIQLWRSDGRHIKTLQVNSDEPWSLSATLSFSPNSQWLAIGGQENGDVVLIGRDHPQEKKLIGHDGTVLALQFSPDSQTLATAAKDAKAMLWKLDGSPIMTLTGHYDWIGNIAFNPDGTLLASASYDQTVKLWKTSYEGLNSLTMTNYVMSSVINPKTGRQIDQDRLVAALEDGSVRMWQGNPLDRTVTTLLDPTPGEIELEPIYPANIGLQFTNLYDGSTLKPPAAIKAVIKNGESYGPVKLWQPNGKPLATIIDKPTKDIESVDVLVSNDGQILVSVVQGDTFFGPVQVWRADGRFIKTLIPRSEGHGFVRLNGKGQYIATQFISEASDKPSPIKTWRWDGSLVSTFQPVVVGDSTSSFDFVGNFPALVTWSNGKDGYGPVQLWQIDGKLQKTLISGRKAESDTDSRVVDVRWDQQGQVLITSINSFGESDQSLVGPVQLWQPNGTLLKTLTDPIKGANFSWVSSSPDGKLFLFHASGSDSFGPVLLWDREKDISISLIESQSKYQYMNVAFSADSQILTTAVSDGPISLWNRNDSSIKTLVEKSQGWTTVGFTPDQKHIIARQNGSKNVDIWDRKGQIFSSFNTEHKGDISSVLVSPDGSQIATSSWDQTVKLWSIEGKLKSIFTDHTASVVDLRFTSDGRQLVSIANDGTPKTLILRDLDNLDDLDLMLNQACEMVANYLKHSVSTTEQQKQLCDAKPKVRAIRHAPQIRHSPSRYSRRGR
ncbi:MAG TPA: TIR domain-containing protein [Trichocoleus sp.]